ncbi:MAG: response regulator [Phycisphaerae bacterium]|nr:response regulator [Phycisphaerae bacterium]
MRTRPLVVVVEDDEEMNQLERELLDMGGLDTLQALTGPEAVDIARRVHPSGFLLDVMLPEMDGFETCRQLRGMNGGHVPIVLVTALDGEDSRRRGQECGADAYFSKPFDPDGVVATLRALIRDFEASHTVKS